MEVLVATEAHLPGICSIAQGCVALMQSRGNEQWDENYPTREHFQKDIAAGSLYVLIEGDELLGCATLDANQAPEYATVKWTLLDEPVAVVHRLMIAPNQMGKGLARILMQKLEAIARRRGCRVMRLDTYIKNAAALRLYDSLCYRRCGVVHFRKLQGDVVCFEKRL